MKNNNKNKDVSQPKITTINTKTRTMHLYLKITTINTKISNKKRQQQ